MSKSGHWIRKMNHMFCEQSTRWIDPSGKTAYWAGRKFSDHEQLQTGWRVSRVVNLIPKILLLETLHRRPRRLQANWSRNLRRKRVNQINREVEIFVWVSPPRVARVWHENSQFEIRITKIIRMKSSCEWPLHEFHEFRTQSFIFLYYRLIIEQLIS